MQTSFRANFLFLLTFLLLSSVAFAQTIDCDPESRPTDCSNVEVRTSCGYYTENCPLEDLCGKLFYNGCEACSNPNVLSYKVGDCEPEKVVFTCKNDTCDPVSDARYALIYSPVCGLDGRSFQTFDNECQLCKQISYPYYQSGTCSIDRTYCDHSVSDDVDSSEDSVYSKDPVCAYVKTQDFGDFYTTVENGSEACKDEAVEFYSEGPCGTLRDNKTYCLPNNRPQACPSVNEPVCAFYQSESLGLEHKIMENSCTACADPEVVFHEPGPCIFTCGRNEELYEQFGCFGSIEPICGTYEENGEEKKVSLHNECLACFESEKEILGYTTGLCPGDKGIRCENEFESFKERFLRPVCGYSTEDCDDDSCRQTYSEPYFACNSPDVIWYSAQPCPGDGGALCDNYRTRPSDPEVLYENVCGFQEQGCSEDSCRKDYADQYDACGDPNVIYFLDGYCGDQ